MRKNSRVGQDKVQKPPTQVMPLKTNGSTRFLERKAIPSALIANASDVGFAVEAPVTK